MGWMHDGFGGSLWMVLFWILVLAGVVWVVMYGNRHSAPRSSERGTDSALDLLKKRYARGEITREQYLEMKRDLEA